MEEISKKVAIHLATEALKGYLRDGIPAQVDKGELIKQVGPNSVLFQDRGCFVTLKTSDDVLRGCVGTIVSEDPLYQNIMENAISAGCKDNRFNPVTFDEVQTLKFEISVMGPLQRVHSLDEIRVGVHGLIMIQGDAQGLLLPQVATEWGWDRETLLKQTCIKAGLPEEAYKDSNTEIFSFSAEIFCEDDVE